MKTLNECRKIQKTIIKQFDDHYPPKPGDGDRVKKMIDAHLKICPNCQREFELMQRIYHQRDQNEKKAEAVIEEINWEENAEFITRRIFSKRFERAKVDSKIGWNWKIVVPVLATIFIMGICIGYILFYNSPGQDKLIPGSFTTNAPVLTKLETTLTKREMRHYFKQTQLFLTDLMRKCDQSDNLGYSSDPIDLNTAKLLLNKNRYFNENKTNPELLSTRRLLKNIEFLLYEIMTLNSDVNCQRLQRIQKHIKEQRILLKLHLVSKDVSHSEV
jgi:hypothetical protein